MAKSVAEYQNSYLEITEILKKNPNVISIFVFGSMVSGDLWEGSNIDLFVIYKDGFNKIRDIYSEVLDIPVHIKFLSKESFKNYLKSAGKRDLIKNYLMSSKLIYSIDNEINELNQQVLYMIDKDKGRWNLSYLGNFYKEVGICKKYLSKGSRYTAHELLIRALNNFSMLYLSINGYTVTKDSLSMACNLNDELNVRVQNLLYKEVTEDSIKALLNYMEGYLEFNIIKAAKEMIDFIKKENRELSAFEIDNNNYFENFKIKTEEILKVLHNNNILVKEKREFRDEKGILLSMENVYRYKE